MPVPSPTRFVARTVAVGLCSLGAALVAAGCSSEKPPTEPEGGLQAFARGVFAQSGRSVWTTLSARNQQLFADALDEMREMNEMVGYMQLSEQEEIRVRAGLDQLPNLQDPIDLFLLLWQPTRIDANERFLVGMTPDDVEEVDATTVSITTEADQTFTLVREGDGIWRVDQPLYGLLEPRVAQIRQNRENLRDTVALFGTGTNLREEMQRFGVWVPPEENSP